MAKCSNMIIGLSCWQTVLVMAVIVILIIVPVISWIIHRHLKNKRTKKQPVPLMYITTVSASRSSDVDIPHLPSPGEPHFLPPSYEDICNGVDNRGYLAVSATTLNVDDDLPEYTSVASHRSSMVLSTFYSDNQSARVSAASIRSDTDSDSDSYTEEQEIENQEGMTERATNAISHIEALHRNTSDKEEHGVFVA